MDSQSNTCDNAVGSGPSPNELVLLAKAKDALENPGLFIRLTDYIGMPIEYAVEKLPSNIRDQMGQIIQKALEAAYNTAAVTIADGAPSWWQTYLNRAAVTASGAAGGTFGITGALVEIPLSTTIMFREMVQNAILHGFDPKDPAICLNVLTCFSFGGRNENDNDANSGYYAVRLSLAKSVSEAAMYFAQKTASTTMDDLGKPVIINLLERIGARFGVVISDEVAAKAVPIVGAVGGAIVNNLFLQHFSAVSNAHFFILKLEKRYGEEAVRELYRNAVPQAS